MVDETVETEEEIVEDVTMSETEEVEKTPEQERPTPLLGVSANLYADGRHEVLIHDPNSIAMNKPALLLGLTKLLEMSIYEIASPVLLRKINGLEEKLDAQNKALESVIEFINILKAGSSLKG